MKNMSLDEAAEFLGVSRDHTRRLIHAGELVAFNVAVSDNNRRKLIVDGHSIESFMHRRRVEPANHVKDIPPRDGWRFVQ